MQGVLLGLLPVSDGHRRSPVASPSPGGVSLGLKGIAFPLLLLRAVRSVDARREVEPFVGYSASLLIGIALLAGSLFTGLRLPLPGSAPLLLVPAALFTAVTGLFIIMARRSAIVQALGYLAMESGIAAFGLALAEQEPLLVEMGTLLDAFVAVFVMGITIFHINREFDHIDSDRLSSLGTCRDAPAADSPPACAAVAAYFIRVHPVRRVLLVATAVVHTGLVCWLWIDPARFPAAGSWLAVDGLGMIFLAITSLLFLCVSVSAVGFLRTESGATRADSEEGFLFDNTPEALFSACLLGFLSAMTLVTASQHFGLLWVAIEATTLVSAPLIHYHRHHRSLEATWKYLLICSVGIAVALLGTYFLAASIRSGQAGTISLTFSNLVAHAGQLETRWLKAAFLLLLVGYGTKMGLAPMHTWLPDAHSEAPSVVSALLSGALLNCAFLAILRILAVCSAAGLGHSAEKRSWCSAWCPWALPRG